MASLLCLALLASISSASKWQTSVEYKWSLACYFRPADIGSQNTVSGAACGNTCELTEGCTHFDWKSNNEECTLKRDPKVRLENAFVDSRKDNMCGIMLKLLEAPSPRPISIAWQTSSKAKWSLSCFFRPADIGKQKTASGEACGRLCAGAEGCTHFDWKSNNEDCTLKRDAKVRLENAFIDYQEDNECGIMLKTLEAPSPRPVQSSNPASSPRTSPRETKDVSQHERLWIWLGPVLGATATVLGSIIAVVCARKERARKKDIKQTDFLSASQIA